MDLSRSTIKKLALLILFAALAFTAFEWSTAPPPRCAFVGSVFSPFLLARPWPLS